MNPVYWGPIDPFIVAEDGLLRPHVPEPGPTRMNPLNENSTVRWCRRCRRIIRNYSENDPLHNPENRPPDERGRQRGLRP